MSSFKRILRDALETGSILSAGLGCLLLFRRKIYPYIFGPMAYGLFTAGAVRFATFLIDLQSNDEPDDSSDREFLRSFEDHQAVLQENKSVLDELGESYMAIREILASWQRDPPLLADKEVILDRILQIQGGETSARAFRGISLESLSDVSQLSTSRFSAAVREIAQGIDAKLEAVTSGLSSTMPAKLKVQVLKRLRHDVLETLKLPVDAQVEALQKKQREWSAKLRQMVFEKIRKGSLQEEKFEKSPEEALKIFQELINLIQTEINVSERAEKDNPLKLLLDELKDVAEETVKEAFEKLKENKFDKELEDKSGKVSTDGCLMEDEVSERQKESKSLQEKVQYEKTSTDEDQVKQKDVEKLSEFLLLPEHLKEDKLTESIEKEIEEDISEKTSDGFEVIQKEEVSEKLEEDKSPKSLKEELEEAISDKVCPLEQEDTEGEKSSSHSEM